MTLYDILQQRANQYTQPLTSLDTGYQAAQGVKEGYQQAPPWLQSYLQNIAKQIDPRGPMATPPLMDVSNRLGSMAIDPGRVAQQAGQGIYNSLASGVQGMGEGASQIGQAFTPEQGTFEEGMRSIPGRAGNVVGGLTKMGSEAAWLAPNMVIDPLSQISETKEAGQAMGWLPNYLKEQAGKLYGPQGKFKQSIEQLLPEGELREASLSAQRFGETSMPPMAEFAGRMAVMKSMGAAQKGVRRAMDTSPAITPPPVAEPFKSPIKTAPQPTDLAPVFADVIRGTDNYDQFKQFVGIQSPMYDLEGGSAKSPDAVNSLNAFMGEAVKNGFDSGKAFYDYIKGTGQATDDFGRRAYETITNQPDSVIAKENKYRNQPLPDSPKILAGQPFDKKVDPELVLLSRPVRGEAVIYDAGTNRLDVYQSRAGGTAGYGIRIGKTDYEFVRELQPDDTYFIDSPYYGLHGYLKTENATSPTELPLTPETPESMPMGMDMGKR